jgi:hypothetical protein
MEALNPRAVFATDIFIREMKRQWIRQNPSADPMSCPVQVLESYPPRQRIALVRAIESALGAFSGMDDIYANWIRLKAEAQPSA